MLPDAAAACILQFLQPADWARLMCVSRGWQQQLVRVLSSAPVEVSIDCSSRSWRAAAAAAGTWCGCITRLSLLQGSARSLSCLALLAPLLQPALTQLTLQGLKLDREGCHAMQLVDLLLQHCPNLTHLNLQDCELPHLGILQRLVPPRANPQQPAQQQPQQALSAVRPAGPATGPRSGLRVLNLTGARLAPGPAPEAANAPGTSHTASTATVSDRLRTHGPAAAGSTCGRGPAAACSDRSTSSSGCADGGWAGGLQELYLGCSGDLADASWLHLNAAVTSDQVIRLLGDHCQGLRVLDVSRRPLVTDDLLLHLAAHPPTQLHTLDVSLTRVTPQALVQLLQHCKQLRVLRYACRSGDGGLDALLLQHLAAVLPAVQELDLSLHPHLDDAGLAALMQCKALRKVKLGRSHKVTKTGIKALCDQVVLQELEVVRCRGVAQSYLTSLGLGRDAA